MQTKYYTTIVNTQNLPLLKHNPTNFSRAPQVWKPSVTVTNRPLPGDAKNEFKISKLVDRPTL